MAIYNHLLSVLDSYITVCKILHEPVTDENLASLTGSIGVSQEARTKAITRAKEIHGLA